MGSQMLRAGIEHEPVLVVLRPTNDPGTRVSEEEFFRTVETMIANEAR
jgi:hypothetical protein